MCTKAGLCVSTVCIVDSNVIVFLLICLHFIFRLVSLFRHSVIIKHYSLEGKQNICFTDRGVYIYEYI
jgi:hypothetical protein